MIGYFILTAAMILSLGYALIHRGGEFKHIYPGLNYYPWNERKHSIGFKLKYTNNRIFAMRLNPTQRRFHIWHTHRNKEDKSWAHFWSL